LSVGCWKRHFQGCEYKKYFLGTLNEKDNFTYSQADKKYATFYESHLGTKVFHLPEKVLYESSHMIAQRDKNVSYNSASDE
jgi:hypothetical protein